MHTDITDKEILRNQSPAGLQPAYTWFNNAVSTWGEYNSKFDNLASLAKGSWRIQSSKDLVKGSLVNGVVN